MKYLKRGFSIAAAIIIFNSSNLPSCAPDFPDAVFTEKHIPPLPDYVQGHLGVLQPTYWRKYLFAAFRYLSDRPLTEKEIHSFLNPSNTATEPEFSSESPGLYAWQAARKKVSDIEPMPYIDVYRNDTAENQWRFFKNCSDDAFKTAARTLEARIQSFRLHPN
jgi:hypothetical protein